jgi:hypothetical protein
VKSSGNAGFTRAAGLRLSRKMATIAESLGVRLFMCGSDATTGNKMMGVSPIFFCRFGCLQVKPAGLPREHLRGHCATDGTD